MGNVVFNAQFMVGGYHLLSFMKIYWIAVINSLDTLFFRQPLDQDLNPLVNSIKIPVEYDRDLYGNETFHNQVTM
jgi:hypothetical protein